MQNPTDRIAHTTAFITPVVEHWLEREIAQWVIFFQSADTNERVVDSGNPMIYASSLAFLHHISYHSSTVLK